MRFPISAVDRLIKDALAEDIGDGDLTTQTLFPGKVKARGKLIANEDGVLCGLPIFKRVFELVDKNISFEARATDGTVLASGQLVARVSGPATSVLQAERTRAEFPPAPLRDFQPDGQVRECGQGHQDAHPRHATNHPWPSVSSRSTRSRSAAG